MSLEDLKEINKLYEQAFRNPEEHSREGFKKMSRIPEFIDALEKMRIIHEKKNADYATASNPFSNFDVSSYFISLFNNPRDQAYACLVGTKMGRLSGLLSSGNTPNNESIEDTFIDIANYILLWRADYLRRKTRAKTIFPPKVAKLDLDMLMHNIFKLMSHEDRRVRDTAIMLDSLFKNTEFQLIEALDHKSEFPSPQKQEG